MFSLFSRVSNWISKDFLLLAIKITVILTLFTPLILAPGGLNHSEYPKILFLRVLIEIASIFYLLLLLLYPNPRYLPRPSLIFWAVLTFFGVLLLSTLTALNLYRSFFGDFGMFTSTDGLITLLHLLALFLIASGLFRKIEDWFYLFRWVVAIGTISSFAGILQKMNIVKLYGLDLPRISGTLGNPDYFAAYILFVIFLGGFLASIETKVKLKILWSALSIFNFIALILAGGRGSWLGMIAALIFLTVLWLVFYSFKNSKMKRLVLFGLLVLSLLFLFVVLNQERIPEGRNLLTQRALSMLDFHSLDTRMAVWELVIGAWKDNPFLGWGLESTSFFYDKYFTSDLLKTIPERLNFTRAHNKVLDLLLNAGLFGVLSYFFIFGSLFYLIFKRKNKIGALPSSLLAALFTAYFVQNLFIFDNASTYLTFFLLLGFANNILGRDETETEPTAENYEILSSIATKILLLFLILCSVWSFYEINLKPAKSGLQFFVARAIEDKNYTPALSLFEKSTKGNTLYDKDFKYVTLNELIWNRENYFDRGHERETMALVFKILPEFEQSLDYPDISYLHSYQLVAKAYMFTYLDTKNQLFLEHSEGIAKSVISFNPDWPFWYRFLGSVKILQNKDKEGEALFRKALSLKPGRYEDLIEYYRELGTTYTNAGNKMAASENFKRAAKVIYLERKFTPGKIKEPLNQDSRQKLIFMEAVADIFYQDLKDLNTAKIIYEQINEVYPEQKSEIEKRLKILESGTN